LFFEQAVAAFAVGGPFGAVVGGKMADQRGRRGALLIDIWAFMLGGVLQTCATNMYVIVLSRFIIGFASGFSSVLVPIYLGELAPPRLRGALGTMTQFAMVIGIFVADILAFPFATESSWRFLFAVTPMVALFQIIASPFLFESPRWLLNHDPKSNLARSIIRQLRGLKHEHEVEHEIGNYILGDAAQHQDESNSQYNIIKEMISHKKIRVLLFSSLVLQMSQQFSGINAVFYYSTSFFEGVIDNPLVGTAIVGGVNVIATYIALLLMDSTGRRTLILWSSAGMFFSCVVIVLSLLGYLSNILALVAVNTYVSFFEIGLGPIPWLIVAEIFEGKYVATAMSLCCQLNWACNFVVGLVFPYMNQYLGAFSFAPFALVLACCFLYAWWVLPETQGTTPEKLISEMIRRNSASVIFDKPLLNSPAAVEWEDSMGKLQNEEKHQMQEGDYGEYIH
jgi:SP family facilitated glucose transporter-like MFS transporter 3